MEYWETDICYFEEIPFFNAFNEYIEVFFTSAGVDKQISYAIWGGTAANLILNFIGRCKIHYSIHDIELFLVKKEKIYYSEVLMNRLGKKIGENKNLLLEIGGQSLIKSKKGMPVDSFQKTRIRLNDGDLYINNLLLIIDRSRGKVLINAPIGIIQNLIAGGNKLDMKSCAELLHTERVARRIYRTISKAIRYEQAAGLSLTKLAQKQIQMLIDIYSKELVEYFSSKALPTEGWFYNNNIYDVESGYRWLYLTVLSETAKRTACLNGINSFDKTKFISFLTKKSFIKNNRLIDQPLIELLVKRLNVIDWNTATLTEKDIEKCYMNFLNYQKPGAERLITNYSLS